MAYEILKGAIAASGDKQDIPAVQDASTANRMSFALGFPLITSQSKNTGGLPPRRADINQAFYLLSNNLYEFQNGAFPTFDTNALTYCPGGVGYPLGAILWYAAEGRFLKSTVANNNNNFLTDPTVIGTSWAYLNNDEVGDEAVGFLLHSSTTDITVKPGFVKSATTGRILKLDAQRSYLWTTVLTNSSVTALSNHRYNLFIAYNAGTQAYTLLCAEGLVPSLPTGYTDYALIGYMSTNNDNGVNNVFPQEMDVHNWYRTGGVNRDKMTRFCVNSGHVDSEGVADLFNVSGSIVNFKIDSGLTYGPIKCSPANELLPFTLDTLNAYNASSLADGTYMLCVNKNGVVTAYPYQKGTYTFLSTGAPASPENGQIWLDVGKEPYYAYRWSGTAWVQFNDVPLGVIGVTSGAVTSNYTFTYNRYSYSAGGESSGKNIGEVFWSQSDALTDNPGALPLFTGEVIQAELLYPDFYRWVEAHTELQTTEVNYQSRINTYGECPFYVIDTTAGTVRLPLLKNYIKNAVQGVGITQSDCALPNIKGFIKFNKSEVHEATGAFLGSTDVKGVQSRWAADGGTPGAPGGVANFNAYNYNPIYKDSTTEVVVKHTTLYPWVQVYNAGVAVSIAQVAEFQTALSGKADTDLANLSATGKNYASGIGMPSSLYIDLTLGASGSEYTAPANGYFTFEKVSTAQTQTSSCDIIVDGVELYGVNAEYHNSWTIPVKKGYVARILYTLAGATQRFRFIYAEGSQPGGGGIVFPSGYELPQAAKIQVLDLVNQRIEANKEDDLLKNINMKAPVVISTSARDIVSYTCPSNGLILLRAGRAMYGTTASGIKYRDAEIRINDTRVGVLNKSETEPTQYRVMSGDVFAIKTVSGGDTAVAIFVFYPEVA